MAPASVPGPEDKDKLAFRMDIVCLVRPEGPHPPAVP